MLVVVAFGWSGWFKWPWLALVGFRWLICAAGVLTGFVCPPRLRRTAQVGSLLAGFFCSLVEIIGVGFLHLSVARSAARGCIQPVRPWTDR